MNFMRTDKGIIEILIISKVFVPHCVDKIPNQIFQ